MKLLSLCVVGLLSVGCEKFTAVPNPVAPGVVEIGGGDSEPLSHVLASTTWTGDYRATVGESGRFTIACAEPISPETINCTVTWTSGVTGLTFTGTASGSVGNFKLEGSQNNPPGGTRCGYQGVAGLNAERTRMDGDIVGVGPGVCSSKRGSFSATRPPDVVVCAGGGTLTFPQGDYVGHFPVGFVDPWYPTSRGPYAFTIPAGTWDFSAVTGDNHSGKPGEAPQKGEMVKFVTDRGHVSPPTIDVPEDRDTQTTTWKQTFSAPITSITVQHAGPLPVVEPTDSVYAVSLTYACPK